MEQIVIRRSECYGFFGEPGTTAEWELTFTVNGVSWLWTNGVASDNSTFPLGNIFLVDIPNSLSTLSISVNGVETDFSSANDVIPAANDIIGSGTNWAIGTTRTIQASNDCFDYTVYYRVECLSVQYGSISEPTAFTRVDDWATTWGYPPITDDNQRRQILFTRLQKFRKMQPVGYSGNTILLTGYESVDQAMDACFPLS
jgi:hypothetical protein